MAYYCGECAVWRGSSDENRYGERWCPVSRRYEKADQNSYGCRGFVDGGRRYCTPVTFDKWRKMTDIKKHLKAEGEIQYGKD